MEARERNEATGPFLDTILQARSLIAPVIRNPIFAGARRAGAAIFRPLEMAPSTAETHRFGGPQQSCGRENAMRPSGAGAGQDVDNAVANNIFPNGRSACTISSVCQKACP